MPGSNAAQRVSVIIERGVALPGVDNANMVIGLNRLFGCDPGEPYREHAMRLEHVLAQLDLMQEGLRRRDIPADLYDGALSALRHAFSPSQLAQHYQQLRSALSADVRLVVKWVAYTLEDEGDPVPPETLAALAASLQALIADIEAAPLPETLREFLMRHLQELLRGLELQPIVGAELLHKAVKGLATDLVVHGDELAEASRDLPEEEQSLLQRAGSLLHKAADAASTAGKGAEGIEKVWKLVTQTGPQVVSWVGSGINAITGP